MGLRDGQGRGVRRGREVPCSEGHWHVSGDTTESTWNVLDDGRRVACRDRTAWICPEGQMELRGSSAGPDCSPQLSVQERAR